MAPKRPNPRYANHANHAVQAVAVAKDKLPAPRRTAEAKAVAKASAAVTHGATDHGAMTVDPACRANNELSNHAQNAPMGINRAVSAPHVAKANNRADAHRANARAVLRNSVSHAKDRPHDRKASAVLPGTTVARAATTNRVKHAPNRTARPTRLNRTTQP